MFISIPFFLRNSYIADLIIGDLAVKMYMSDVLLSSLTALFTLLITGHILYFLAFTTSSGSLKSEKSNVSFLSRL